MCSKITIPSAMLKLVLTKTLFSYAFISISTMNKPIAIIALILSLNACAQDSTYGKSDYEVFVSRTGNMIKTETFDAGSYKDYKIAVYKSTELATQLSSKALALTQSKNMWLVGNYVIAAFYIDWQEADGFSKALHFMSSLLESTPPRNVGYNYSTKNGIQASCSFFTEGQNAGWTLVISRLYKYSRSYVDGSAWTIKKKDLPDVLNLFDQALKKEF
jgi:hypothetical protein